MPFPFDSTSAKTVVAMADPQPGDLFTEMYNYWVYVLERTEFAVTIFHFNHGTKGTVASMLLPDFREKYRYGNIDGYWIQLYKRDTPLTNILQYVREWVQSYDEELLGRRNKEAVDQKHQEVSEGDK